MISALSGRSSFSLEIAEGNYKAAVKHRLYLNDTERDRERSLKLSNMVEGPSSKVLRD